jgi:hypothetical protein
MGMSASACSPGRSSESAREDAACEVSGVSASEGEREGDEDEGGALLVWKRCGGSEVEEGVVGEGVKGAWSALLLVESSGSGYAWAWALR